MLKQIESFRNERLWHFSMLVICLWLMLTPLSFGQCQYHENCYQKCKNKVCRYEPLTNSFYNASIPKYSSYYHGPGCCQGCAEPYYQDHYYNSTNLTCDQYSSCPQYDWWGHPLFWVPFYTNYTPYYFGNSTSLPGCVRGCYFLAFYNSSYGAARYTNYDSQRCEYSCSSNYFKLQWNLTCVKSCPYPFYGDLGSYTCQYSCYSPYFTNNYTRTCQSICSQGTFGVNIDTIGLYECRKQCPYLYFKHNSTKMCLLQCPDGYYKYKPTKQCVPHCYNNGLKYFYNHQHQSCQKYCPDGLVGDPYTGFCLDLNLNCPSGMYKLLSAHRCVYDCATSAPNSPTPNAKYIDSQKRICKPNEFVEIITFIAVMVGYLFPIALMIAGGIAIYHKFCRFKLPDIRSQIPSDEQNKLNNQATQLNGTNSNIINR